MALSWVISAEDCDYQVTSLAKIICSIRHFMLTLRLLGSLFLHFPERTRFEAGVAAGMCTSWNGKLSADMAYLISISATAHEGTNHQAAGDSTSTSPNVRSNTDPTNRRTLEETIYFTDSFIRFPFVAFDSFTWLGDLSKELLSPYSCRSPHVRYVHRGVPWRGIRRRDHHVEDLVYGTTMIAQPPLTWLVRIPCMKRMRRLTP